MIHPRLVSPTAPGFHRARARAVSAAEHRAHHRRRVMMMGAGAVILLLTLMTAQPARAAGWVLDPDASILSFGSIKAGHIGEVHEFRNLQGSMDDSGTVEVIIDLASVSTGIDIRDDRMRQMLFNVATFPVAKVAATVPVGDLNDLAVGDSAFRDVTASLSLVGETHDLPMPLMVTRLTDDRVLVHPLRLVILQADVYALADGIEMLRAVAGLDQISSAVPVTFAVTFQRAE